MHGVGKLVVRSSHGVCLGEAVPCGCQKLCCIEVPIYFRPHQLHGRQILPFNITSRRHGVTGTSCYCITTNSRLLQAISPPARSDPTLRFCAQLATTQPTWFLLAQLIQCHDRRSTDASRHGLALEHRYASTLSFSPSESNPTDRHSAPTLSCPCTRLSAASGASVAFTGYRGFEAIACTGEPRVHAWACVSKLLRTTTSNSSCKIFAWGSRTIQTIPSLAGYLLGYMMPEVRLQQVRLVGLLYTGQSSNPGTLYP